MAANGCSTASWSRRSGSGVKDVYYSYRLVLRPWLWLRRATADCRIFSGQEGARRSSRRFSTSAASPTSAKLTEDLSKLEYCVQYRETDLTFVSRLMEQHGIYYFFDIAGDKHVLVLADSKSSHEPVPGREKRSLHSAGRRRSTRPRAVYQWSRSAASAPARSS